ncbi:MAG: hypothetical protein V8T31_02610 [Lachnospiraceae bacterium]
MIRTLIQKEEFQVQRKLAIVRIGMGNRENMTVEAQKACMEADLLIGAGRMLEQITEPENLFLYPTNRRKCISMS